MYIHVKVIYLNYDLVIVFMFLYLRIMKNILNSFYITLLCRFIVFTLFPYKCKPNKTRDIFMNWPETLSYWPRLYCWALKLEAVSLVVSYSSNIYTNIHWRVDSLFFSSTRSPAAALCSVFSINTGYVSHTLSIRAVLY